MPIFPKYDESVDFLALFRPGGPHLLTAIPVNGGHLSTKLFSTEGIAEWCQATNSGHGIYYHVAIPRDGVAQRLSKDKVSAVDHLWVDIDPPAGGTREEILDRLLTLQSGVPSLPNYVVDSGNGFQALWKLSSPVDDIELAERATRFLVDIYRGDRQAWNVDRLLRLPGTINYPNSRKLKEGRKPTLSTFRRVHDDPTPFEKFSLASPLEKGKEVKVKINGPTRTYSPEDLPDEISDKWKDIITFCQDSWYFADAQYASRSEAVMGAVRYMLEQNIGEQVIYDILLSKDLGISGHIYDQPDVHRYAKRQIEQGRRFMSSSFLSEEREEEDLNFIFSAPPMKDGKPNGTPTIIPTIIQNCVVAVKKLGVECAYNVMSDIMTINGKPFEDHLVTKVRLDAEQKFKVTFSQEMTKQVLQTLCQENPVNPVEDYLDNLPEWDKKPRSEEWLIKYFGVEDTEFNRAISRIVLIAAVRRIRKPGCKFDEMLILEGEQGDGKSLLLGEGLVPNPAWFNDHLTLDKGPKEFMEDTLGHWIIECSELVSMRKAQVDHVKAILSRQTDKARMAYARSRTDRPRRFIIIGSTNQENYLIDDTGNRRFWPVKTSGRLYERVKDLAKVRDQLWAEASYYEARGDSIRLNPRFYKDATIAQKSRQVENVFLDPVQTAVGDSEGVVRLSALLDYLNVPYRERTGAQYKIASALRELGFTKIMVDKKKIWKRGDSMEEIKFQFDDDHC